MSSALIYGCMGSDSTRSQRLVATGQQDSFASLGMTVENAVCKCIGFG